MAGIAYTEKRPNCAICHYASFGAYVATFAKKDGDEAQLVFLCAECSFLHAWQIWSGHFSRKLKALRLEVIFKFPGQRGEDMPKPISPMGDAPPATYTATFMFEGERYTGPLDPCEGGNMIFSTAGAAIERGRQVGQALARGLHKHNHWEVQLCVSRKVE